MTDKKRGNNQPRNHDLTMKRVKSLSRKALGALEEELLNPQAETSTKLQAAKIILQLNNEMLYHEGVNTSEKGV